MIVGGGAVIAILSFQVIFVARMAGFGDPESALPHADLPALSLLPLRSQIPLTRGFPSFVSISAESAQTSASSRSGERPDESPPSAKSHISSSSSGNAPTCFTRPCS